MAVPGFSVSELLAALKKLRDVWDAFFDEFDNAPGRISELNDTILILDSALQFFAGLSQFQGVPPPLRLVHSYLHKLEECRKFIKKYESLTGRQSHGQNLIQIGRKSRDTIRYAFDGDAAILKNDLMLEAQKLNLIASLLQLSVTPTLINNGSLTKCVKRIVGAVRASWHLRHYHRPYDCKNCSPTNSGRVECIRCSEFPRIKS